MTKLPSSLERLINELAKLPGIGPKSAQRLAFYILKREDVDVAGLARAIEQVKKDINFCSICHNMAQSDPCGTCTDPARDHALICVVEEPLDALAIDKTGQFNGVFHILGGVLNPMEGIGPDKLNMDSLKRRVTGQNTNTEKTNAKNPASKNSPGQGNGNKIGEKERGRQVQKIREVIIATNPSLEGETTAMHLAKLLKDSGAKITRIARGLPMGGDLEYADEITLTRALEGRREY